MILGYIQVSRAWVTWRAEITTPTPAARAEGIQEFSALVNGKRWASAAFYCTVHVTNLTGKVRTAFQITLFILLQAHRTINMNFSSTGLSLPLFLLFF